MQSSQYNPQGDVYLEAHRLMKINIDWLNVEREKATTQEEVDEIESKIEEVVALFNQAWPKPENYIDEATGQGAFDLVDVRERINTDHHYEDDADLLAFRAKKRVFREEIDSLWKQHHAAKIPKMATILEGMINTQVEEWNVQYPKGPTYLDLHGMSEQGAKDYVARMAEGSGKKWLLEVGQGKHSWNGVPKIKEELLKKYGANIKVHSTNKGLLVLDLRPIRY